MNLLLPALFGLVGTMLGATISYFSASNLQKRSEASAASREREARAEERESLREIRLEERAATNRAQELERLQRRGEAIGEWVDAMIVMAGVPGPYPEKDSPAVRVNRANIRLTLLLVHGEQAVVRFVGGLTNSLAMSDNSEVRMGLINQGGQVLVDWHRGLIDDSRLGPFEFVAHGPKNQLMIRNLDEWPDVVSRG